MNVTALRGAVAGSDVKSLSQISGVGKKNRRAHRRRVKGQNRRGGRVGRR